jgi:hypothetical protein
MFTTSSLNLLAGAFIGYGFIRMYAKKRKLERDSVLHER